MVTDWSTKSDSQIDYEIDAAYARGKAEGIAEERARLREACLKAVHAEHLSDNTGHGEDVAYDQAVTDCYDAIESVFEASVPADPA